LSALTAISDLEEQLNEVIETARKPLKHEHRHTIDITSICVFLSLIGLVVLVIGLSYIVGEQRETISRYRYVKMHGKADEESIYRLERQYQDNSQSGRTIRGIVTRTGGTVRASKSK
jgi:ABC-type lipoprotein release transport system permease subunit